MGKTELEQALRQEGEERMRSLWKAAETAVAERRREVESELARLKEEHDERLQAEAKILHSKLLSEARRRAMTCRLQTEAELQERLLRLARDMLTDLVNSDREQIWQALREEVPDLEWATVRFHPDDVARARRDFQHAAQEPDEALGGGMVVINRDGSIRIDNSLLCRLLRGWSELLPGLMNDLRTLVEDDETTHRNPAI